MVLWALANAHGGEILAPKILLPHHRRGQRHRPELPPAIVGGAPGEKIHEEMITASDSLNTVDLGRLLRHPAERGLVQRGRLRGAPARARARGLQLRQRRAPISQRRAAARADLLARLRADHRHASAGRLNGLRWTASPTAAREITEADIAAVSAVLRSELVTQGPVVQRFEQAFAQRHAVAHAVAVSNATSALHLACLALGVGPGSRVWTSPISFVASPTARSTAAPRWISSTSIRPRATSRSIACATSSEDAEPRGELPDVVVPVDFAGLPLRSARSARAGRPLRLQAARRRLARHRRELPRRPGGERLGRRHGIQLPHREDPLLRRGGGW